MTKTELISERNRLVNELAACPCNDWDRKYAAQKAREEFDVAHPEVVLDSARANIRAGGSAFQLMDLNFLNRLHSEKERAVSLRALRLNEAASRLYNRRLRHREAWERRGAAWGKAFAVIGEAMVIPPGQLVRIGGSSGFGWRVESFYADSSLRIYSRVMVDGPPSRAERVDPSSEEQWRKAIFEAGRIALKTSLLGMEARCAA